MFFAVAPALLAPSPLLAQAVPVMRAAPPIMQSDPDISPELRQQLTELQAKNQQRGAVALSLVVAVCVWLFSVPPDIRRTDICEIANTRDCMEFSALANRVATHYQTCGSEGAPACVAFDFSIDPKSREAFDRNVEALLGDSDPLDF